MAKELNLKLNKAKEKKDDEFYTRLEDIQIECINYKEQFKNKIVYLNCDKVNFSNFYFYFKDKFKEFDLKKVVLTSLGSNFKHEIILEDNELKEIKTELKKDENFTDGDFKSPACLEILKEIDIVVTNPPFSLFRLFVDKMLENNKSFLIIGFMPAMGHKNIFNTIYNRKIWVGYNNNTLSFFNEQKEIKEVSICWYTNLIVNKEPQEFNLIKKYDEIKYPKYDNLNAIEVSRLKDIPGDYYDLMGVPITYLKNRNDYLFELIGIDRWFVKSIKLNNKKLYYRVIIKRKRGESET